MAVFVFFVTSFIPPWSTLKSLKIKKKLLLIKFNISILLVDNDVLAVNLSLCHVYTIECTLSINIFSCTIYKLNIPIARQYTWLSSNYDPDSHPENRESASRYWDKSFVFFGGVTPFLSKFV